MTRWNGVARVSACVVVVHLLLAAGSALGQEYIYFRDTFNRPDNNNLNASTDGKAGKLGPLTWSKTVFGASGTRSADILDNCLRMRNQTFVEGCIAWPDHNFTEPTGEFWVSTVVVAMYNAGDGRTAGFGVGQNLADLTSATTVTPTAAGAPNADVYVSYDNVGANRYVYIYTNKTLVTSIPLTASLPDRVSARYTFGSMTAGSALNYDVFLDGTKIYSGSTVWSGTDENYISVCANTTGDTTFDSFTVADAFFLDDFEGYAPGALVPSGTSNILRHGSLSTVRDEGTSTPFGTTNQYAELKDASSTATIQLMSQQIPETRAALTTLSLDFSEPSTGGADALTVGYSRSTYILTTPYYRIRVSLKDGQVLSLATGSGSYSYDTPYRLYIIFNDTDATVKYGDYGNTIAPLVADVWLRNLENGNLEYVGTCNAGNARADYSVGCTTLAAGLQEIYIDNLALSMGAVLTFPPPRGTMVLIR